MDDIILEELLMLDSHLFDLFIIDLVGSEQEMSDSDSSSVNDENEQHIDETNEEIDEDSSNDSLDSDGDDTEDENDEDNNSSDEELINNIVMRQNATSTNPNAIKVNTIATDLSFHPDKNVVAVSDMEGHVLFYDIDNASTKVNDIVVHNDSIRSIDHFPEGNRIASVSSDGSFSFTNIETKKITPVNIDSEIDLEFYVVKTLNKDICITGHENGCVKLWDVRTASQIASTDASEDTVNFIHYANNVGRVYLTTGYGELIVYDVRNCKKFKPLKKSDPFTSELTCCTTLRSDRNVICGSGQGDLLLFDWEPFDYQPYKPNNTKKEILSIVGATENIVITGNENGNINAYHLYPNRPIGLIGTHNKWDVTKLDINHSGNILASLAEDEIKFWEISFLEDVENVITRNRERDKTSYALPSSQLMSRQEFFSDLNEDDNT